jgi:hypothetical protein
MTDWKRAIVLIEYDDGARNAFEFLDLESADLNHRGLPGPATFRMAGRVRALRQPAPIEQAFIDAIDALAPGEPQ